MRGKGRLGLAESIVKRLVLFDIDGTILLSGGAGRRAILAALAGETEGDLTPAERVRFDGKTDPQIVVELLEALGHPEPRDQPRIARVIDRYVGLLEADLAVNGHRATVMPGIVPLLERLEQDQRIVLGLLTGNVALGAAIKLKTVGIEPTRFRLGAYGSDHAERSELPGFAVYRAIPFFGRPPAGDEIVIIGDTPADVTCGIGVGARAIGVGTGSFTPEVLTAAGAWAAFADLTDADRVHSAILGSSP